MSGSNRGGFPKARLIVSTIVFVAALLFGTAGILFGLAKQAEYERASYERSREYTADTYGPAYNACLRLSGVSQVDCIAQTHQERRENTRQEDDLVAQQTMSVWTFLMGGAAIVGMLLSAVGVYLVYSTFQEAKRTANAAVDANELALRLANTQMRAWIGFDSWDLIRNGVPESGVIDFYLFELAWKVVGSTPAHEVRIVTDRSDKLDPDFSGQVGTSTAPNIVFHSRPVAFSPQEIFSTRDNPVKIRAVVSYKTAFGELAVTDAEFEIRYIGLGDLDDIIAGKITPRNFRFTPGGANDRMT